VPKSGKCIDIPDCQNITDSTSDKEKICCGVGATVVYACCKGKGFTLSPTTFNTTSPTSMTHSPTIAPTVYAQRMCIDNYKCQIKSELLFSDKALDCYFDATETTLFPKGTTFNSTGRCTVAVHKNKLCCPDRFGIFNECCDTRSPSMTTSSPVSISPSTTTTTPTSSSPTTTRAGNTCGAHQACVDLGKANDPASICCPYSAEGLTDGLISILMNRSPETLSDECCPCNTDAGNKYKHVCKDKTK